MKKATNIHNLDTLEREIYRLQVEAKNMEKKFDRNCNYLQHHYSSMFVNSFFRRKRDSDEGKKNFFESFFNNDKFHAAITAISDRLADKATEIIEKLMAKIFPGDK